MKNLEDKLQQACVMWFRLQYPDVVIFSIPNGGSRNPIEAAKLKRTGTLAGVADLFVMKSKAEINEQNLSIDYYNGLFVELKIGKNKQTESQVEFEDKVKQAGYAYHVCRSLDEFMNVVNDYLK